MSYSLKQLVQFDASNLSAFGSLETAELTPVFQTDFVYGINSQVGAVTVANSATADTNAGRLRLQSGTNTAGSALYQSRVSVKYRAGQGVVARYTAAFVTSAASNTQIVGVGDAVNGYFFGFNGTSFGILHRNASSDTWVAQASWNGDKADGTGASAFNLNKTYGNVYMIKYPYLGYGDINFFIEDSNSGRFILVHTIKYANTSATVQLSNPNLYFYARSLNAGSTTNCTVYVGSVGVFLSGERMFVTNPKWATDNNKTGVTAETVILSLKNATTYNGVANRSLIRLNSISVGADATAGKVGVIRLRLGATVGGSPSFAAISGTTADSGVTITSGNSIASVDVAGTTATAGSLIFNLAIATPGNQIIDLVPYDLYIAPAEILTISAYGTASSTFAVAVNWSEDI